ncbi:MAG: vitamin B12 dependent-methionine synthase activation domain-containing protein [Elusimicrobiota bacterium]
MTINLAHFGKIDINPDKVLARLGYTKGRTVVNPATENLLEDEIRTAKKLLTPKYVMAYAEIKVSDKGHVLLNPRFEIFSKDIIELLKGCVKAYGFAVTIGPFLEDKRNEYIKDNLTTKALMLDAVGSVAAEELAETVNAQISAEAEKEGFKTTRRFSPGYGDWKLEGQKDFLDWLGAKTIGIKLTGSSQMLPEKSISAILGVKI